MALISQPLKLPNGQNVHQIKYQPPSRKLQSAFSESIIAAKRIAQAAKLKNKKVKIFLSGGIDSEAMARAFIAAEVEFDIVIGRYDGQMNSHDICHALSFCREQEIVPEIIDIDVFEFLDSGEYLDYAMKYSCRSPQVAVHLKLLNKAGDAVFVLGGNPILPVMQDAHTQIQQASKMGISFKDVVGVPDQTQAAYFRYFEKENRLGFPFFFQSAPELVHSFLILDTSVKLMAEGATFLSYIDKSRIYREAGFDVSPRENKFTGFEAYRSFFDLKLQMQNGEAFNKLYREPLEKMFPTVPHLIWLPFTIGSGEKILGHSLKRNSAMNRRQVLEISLVALAGLLIPGVARAGQWCCYPEGCMVGEPGCTCETVPGPKC